MNKKTAVKALSVLIAIVMCFTSFSFGTSAVSLDKTGSITLTTLSKESKEPISGATFRVYLFASAYTAGDSVAYVYTEQFRDNGMEMGNFSDAYLPVHLAAYAELMALPYTEKTTDSDGRVVFEGLPCGAYLVVPAGIDEGYLNPNPFIVSVPMKDETQNKWVYNVDATPKIETDNDDTEEKTYISVKKQWQGTGKTPDSIAVSLVKDGNILQSVILSAENNWYHKWENLDKNHSWSVVESGVPAGYKVSYVTSQMTVIITNTADDYDEETTTSPDETTTSDDTTVPDDTTKPDGSTTTTSGTTQSTTKPEELIDTGQLNWPIPIFSIAGLVIFSAGWILLNFGKKDEETV